VTMAGSCMVIVERMKFNYFRKLSSFILKDIGYNIMTKIPWGKGHKNITDFEVEKNGRTSLAIIYKSKGKIEPEFIQFSINKAEDLELKSVVIITPQDVSDKTALYIRNVDVHIITRETIDNWLNSRFETVNEFIYFMDRNKIKSLGFISIEELIANFYNIQEKIGKRPGLHDMKKHSDYGSSQYTYKWSTWNNFLASIDEKTKMLNFRPNKTQTATFLALVENYMRIRKKMRKEPTSEEMDKYGKYPIEYYNFRFGSYSNFIMLMGNEIEKWKNFTKKQLVKEFQKIKTLINRPPTITDMNKHSTISPVLYVYRWNTWNEFLEYVNERPQFNGISDKEMYCAYIELEERLKKPPSNYDFKNYYKYTSETLSLKFGRWQSFTNTMKNKEYSLEIEEIDLFSDYYKIKKILGKDILDFEDIRRHTSFNFENYLNVFSSWDRFFNKIDMIEKDCQNITKEELVYEYLKLLAELKRTSLNLNDILRHSSYYYPLYLCKFLGWTEFIIYLRQYISSYPRARKHTNDEIVNEYFRLEKKLNKSPLSYTDIKKHSNISVKSIKNQFGSWALFLARIERKPVSFITKEDCINEYLRIKNLLKVGTVKGRHFIEHSKYSMGVINKRFGGWINFLKEINEDSGYYKHYTRQQLIDAYFKVKQLTGKDKLLFKDVENHLGISKTSYENQFGSWINFLKIYDKNNAHRRKISDDELIAEYFRVKKVIGKKYISVKDFVNHSKYSAGPYLRFGTWNKFLEKIGEKTIKIDYSQISNEDLINEYKRMCVKLNKKQPSYKDISKHSIYRHSVYEKRWGKWSLFTKYFQELVNQPKSDILN
jgi:hypothetical protein